MGGGGQAISSSRTGLRRARTQFKLSQFRLYRWLYNRCLRVSPLSSWPLSSWLFVQPSCSWRVRRVLRDIWLFLLAGCLLPFVEFCHTCVFFFFFFFTRGEGRLVRHRSTPQIEGARSPSAVGEVLEDALLGALEPCARTTAPFGVSCRGFVEAPHVLVCSC